MQAKYGIMIPKVDNLGNQLTSLAEVAHHHLFYGPLKVEGSYIDPDKLGQWRDESPEPHDILVVYAEDHPEMDSQMKLLASQIAEVANQWGIFVTKEGKSGIQSWIVDNPGFRPGEPAEDLALAQRPSANLPPASDSPELTSGGTPPPESAH